MHIATIHRMYANPLETRTDNLTWYVVDQKVIEKKAFEYGILGENERKEYEIKQIEEKLKTNEKHDPVFNFLEGPKKNGKHEPGPETEDRKTKIKKLKNMVPAGSTIIFNNERTEKNASKSNKGTTLCGHWTNLTDVKAEIVVSGKGEKK